MTLMTSSRIVAYNWDAVLSAQDLLALQGYSLEAVGKVRPGEASEIRHAVGEGMFLPSLAGVMAAVLCCSSAPWNHSQSALNSNTDQLAIFDFHCQSEINRKH